MYFFIAIILIAELIITVNVINIIMKCDKKVCGLIETTAKAVPVIKYNLLAFQIAVTKFVLGVHTLFEYAENRKQLYVRSVVRNLVMYVLLFILKGKSKKCLSILQLACLLRECWDKGAACNS